MSIAMIFSIIVLIIDVLERKHISKIKKMSVNMPKIIQDVTKPPENLKDFWKIFLGFDEKLKGDIVNIKHDLDSNKRHQKIRTALSIISVIATIVAVIVAYFGIVGLLAPPIEHIKTSDVRANEDIFKVQDFSIYTLTISNYGDKLAKNLRVEIEFNDDLYIDEIYNDDGLLIPNPNGGNDTYFYEPCYENINVNETIEIRLVLKNKGGEYIIWSYGIEKPTKLEIWTDDGDVPIS